MSNMRRNIVLLVLGCLAAGLASWAIFAGRDTAHDEITIGFDPWPAYEYLYLADKKGFFAQEGLNIRLVQFSSLADVSNAYSHGNIDGMTVTTVELLTSYRFSGRLSNSVLVTDYSDGADVIIANASVRTVKELRGRKVAVEPNSLGLLMLSRALEREGMGFKDITLQTVDLLNMATALKKGKVDAVVCYPPFSLKVLKIPGARVIFDSRSIPGEIIDMVAIDPAVLKAQPEFARRLRAAWKKALAFARAHPDEADAIMAEREGVTMQEFRDSLQGIRIVDAENQAEFFLPGGKVYRALVRTQRMLQEFDDANRPPDDPAMFIHPREPGV